MGTYSMYLSRGSRLKNNKYNLRQYLDTFLNVKINKCNP